MDAAGPWVSMNVSKCQWYLYRPYFFVVNRVSIKSKENEEKGPDKSCQGGPGNPSFDGAAIRG